MLGRCCRRSIVFLTATRHRRGRILRTIYRAFGRAACVAPEFKLEVEVEVGPVYCDVNVSVSGWLGRVVRSACGVDDVWSAEAASG